MLNTTSGDPIVGYAYQSVSKNATIYSPKLKEALLRIVDHNLFCEDSFSSQLKITKNQTPKWLSGVNLVLYGLTDIIKNPEFYLSLLKILVTLPALTLIFTPIIATIYVLAFIPLDFLTTDLVIWVSISLIPFLMENYHFFKKLVLDTINYLYIEPVAHLKQLLENLKMLTHSQILKAEITAHKSSFSDFELEAISNRPVDGGLIDAISQNILEIRTVIKPSNFIIGTFVVNVRSLIGALCAHKPFERNQYRHPFLDRNMSVSEITKFKEDFQNFFSISFETFEKIYFYQLKTKDKLLFGGMDALVIAYLKAFQFYHFCAHGHALFHPDELLAHPYISESMKPHQLSRFKSLCRGIQI
jgi:hypothetical protein